MAALVAGALGMANAATAIAAPAWLPVSDVSKPGRDAFSPSVAVDSAGNTVVIWERENQSDPSHNIQASTRAVGGAFGEPVDISLRSTEPRLAMTPGGEAVAAWKHFQNPPGNYVIQVATRPPGGQFGAPANVYSAPKGLIPQELELAVGSGGAVAVVWSNLDPTTEFTKLKCEDEDPAPDPACSNPFFVEGSVRPAGGAFSPPVRISPPRGTAPEGETAEEKDKREQQESKLSTAGPAVAVDGAGNTTAVWSYFDGTDVVIQAVTKPAGGAFSAPVPISAAGENAGLADIGMDAAGNAIAVWARADGTARRVQAAAAPPGGAFDPAVNISPAGVVSDSPSVATSAGGVATVVWRLNGLAESFIQTATRPPGGSFSEPVTVSSGKDDPIFPEIAVNDGGGAAVAWSGASGTSQVSRATVRPPGAAFLPPENISKTSSDVFHATPAMDGAGNTTAVWSRSNGSHDIIQMAGFDAVGPELRNLSIPASGIVGEPVQFSVSPFDAWPLGPASFSFGDGGTASGNSPSHTYGAPGSYRVEVSVTDSAGTAGTAAGTITIRPRGKFSLGKLKRNRKKGTARLPVTVDGPGVIAVTGRGVRRASVRATRAGTVKLPIRAVGRAREELFETGKRFVRLRVAFTPDGGSAGLRRQKVKLLKKLG